MKGTIALFSPSFNPAVSIETRPEHLSAETGALVQREIMERSGIIGWLAERLHDPRNRDLIRYPLEELLRTQLLLMGQGWRDQDDADRLRHDPSLRVGNDCHEGTRPLEEDEVLASQPTLSRLLGGLSGEGNLAVLHEAVTELACRRVRMSNGGRRKKTLYIDVDGLPVEVHGGQPGSEWNGYYRRRMYQALVASSGETGDLLDGELRCGASYLGHGALEFIVGVVERCRGRLCESVVVRMDAGFPEAGLLRGLEEGGVRYVARLKGNAVLDRMARPYLSRPPGRPPREPRRWCYEHEYRAESWEKGRRVVLVVLEREGELFLDHFWLLTNLDERRWDGHRLLSMYRKRGKAEGHMGELMDVLRPALSSVSRAKTHYRGRKLEVRERDEEVGVRPHNEALFVLNLLVYELMHLGRSVMERATHRGWSLRRYRDEVLRVASRVQCEGRRVVFILCESAVLAWRRLWRVLTRLHWVPV